MRRLTWEQAEALYPECSAAAERDSMHEAIGDLDKWELFELQSYTSTSPLDANGNRVTVGVEGTSLWIFVGDKHRAKYDQSANLSLPGGRWMLFCPPQPAKPKHNMNVTAVGREGTGLSSAFIARCSCGYLSAYYSTLQHARRDADRHIQDQQLGT